MAKYTFNGADGKLGSFEGVGKSRFGDQRLGSLGAFAGPVAAIEADMALARTLVGGPMMHVPQAWKYPQHAGMPPAMVLNSPFLAQEQAKAAQLQQRPQQQQPQSSGPSAGEVMTGVGSIIGALANPLANIFATTQQVELEKERLKRQGQAPAGGMDANMMAMMMARRNQPQGGNNTALIIGLVVVVAVIIGVVVLKG